MGGDDGQLHQRSWHDDEYDKNLKYWKSKNKGVMNNNENGLNTSFGNRPTGNDTTDFDLLERNNVQNNETTYTEEEISEDGPYSILGLTDEEILAKLPRSMDDLGNARALSKCTYEGCTRQASYKGLCSQHVCELYRRGEIDIKDTQATEVAPRSPVPWEPRSETLDQRRRTKTPKAQGHQQYMHCDDEYRQTATSGYGARLKTEQRNSRERRPREVHRVEDRSRKKCVSPMCTKTPTSGEFCDECALKVCSRSDYARRTPKKSKWQCVNQHCDRPTNTKHGLCSICDSILMDANAKRVPMPKPEVLPPKRHARQSSKPGNKENDSRISRQEYELRSPRGSPFQAPYKSGKLLQEPQRHHYEPIRAEGHHYDYERQPRKHRHQSTFYDSDPCRYQPDPQEAVHGFEIIESSGPASMISDVSTSSATDDDYSLCSYVSNKKPNKCKSTGCANFGNAACAGFCNACYIRFTY